MKIANFVFKAQRKVFGEYMGKLFYQPRVDKYGNPLPLRKLFGRINQFLMENGYSPPWILTKQECYEFWSSTTDEEKFGGTRIGVITTKPPGIVQFLNEFLKPQVRIDFSILELGGGCGVNLNSLHNMGYSDLRGIEINTSAVEMMKTAFPELTSTAKIRVGSLEDTLPTMEPNSVDVIFTMAVAYHIHPTSNFIFREMMRIARKYICTIELESANCDYVFARNYGRVFQRLGCLQIKSIMITEETFPEVSRNYDGFIGRLFSIPE